MSGVHCGVIRGHLIRTRLAIGGAGQGRQTGTLGEELIDAVDAVLVDVAGARRRRRLASEVGNAAGRPTVSTLAARTWRATASAGARGAAGTGHATPGARGAA